MPKKLVKSARRTTTGGQSSDAPAAFFDLPFIKAIIEDRKRRLDRLPPEERRRVIRSERHSSKSEMQREQRREKVIAELHELYIGLLKGFAAFTEAELKRVESDIDAFAGYRGKAGFLSTFFNSSHPAPAKPPDLVLLKGANRVHRVFKTLRSLKAKASDRCIECSAGLPRPRGKRLFCSKACANRYHQRAYKASTRAAKRT